jgi:hypothetical protein
MINHSNYLILIISVGRPIGQDAQTSVIDHFKIITQNFSITVYISCVHYTSVSSIVIYYNSLMSGLVLVQTNSSDDICLCCLNAKLSDPDFPTLKPQVTFVCTNLQTVTAVYMQIMVN